MSTFPITQKEYIEAVSRETARMSYPGSMSRSKTPVLLGGTKKKIEEGFFLVFLGELWDRVDSVATQFDTWHKKQALELGQFLSLNGCLGNPGYGDAVAAKLINTFMYQLMKYVHFRPLWSKLHLPLDRKMLKALSDLQSSSLKPVKVILGKYKECPYLLSYDGEYKPIQIALGNLVDELNSRPNAEYQLTSKIELNLLWAD